MIIDSHAHYALKQFNGEFRYLYDNGETWSIGTADRDILFAEMQKCGVVGSIEPAIEFGRIETQLHLVEEKSDRMWAAVGVHPTRCVNTDREAWKKLPELAKKPGVVAIGETGLDHHLPDEWCSRAVQKEWFIYQLELADSLALPMVLHIRDADEDALEILEKNKQKLHGGVVHCFKSDSSVAKRYIELGYTIGVGGKIFLNDGEGEALRDTVRSVPLSSLLVETDSPLVAPDVDETVWLNMGESEKPKYRNSSLILPAVIRRIAELRGESEETVEDTIYRNTIRVFDLRLNA